MIHHLSQHTPIKLGANIVRKISHLDMVITK